MFACYHSLETANQLCKKDMRHGPRRPALPEPLVDLILQAFSDAVMLAGLYTLMAVGLSLGFGVVRIINFAQGEMIMLGVYGAFWLFTLVGVAP